MQGPCDLWTEIVGGTELSSPVPNLGAESTDPELLWAWEFLKAAAAKARGLNDSVEASFGINSAGELTAPGEPGVAAKARWAGSTAKEVLCA